MRSNGLTAANYTPVADLDPHMADALLADLREHGVAAYSKPVESSTVAGFDRPEYRVGVKERLYVDAASSTRALELIASRDPDLLSNNDDLTWAQLVAGYDRPVTAAIAPWPVDEDLRLDEPRVLDERDLAALRPPDETDDRPRRRWGQRIGAETTDDDEFLTATSQSREPAVPAGSDDVDPVDRFVPEDPPPLPDLPPYKVIAWAGLIGGPLVLLLATIFSYQLPGWGAGLAIVGFVGGFVTLVATMGDDDDTWGPDNGAVV